MRVRLDNENERHVLIGLRDNDFFMKPRELIRAPIGYAAAVVCGSQSKSP